MNMGVENAQVFPRQTDWLESDTTLYGSLFSGLYEIGVE